MESGAATTVGLALCLSCLALLVWKRMRREGKLPPGPFPLPFLGNLLHIRTDATFQSFMELKEKYGPVFTVYLGPRPVVVLCGHEAVKEALVDQAEEFGGRGELASIDRNFQGHGVAFANGERWRVLRRFSLTTLRNFGMGKRSIEERIQEEAQCLLREFRKTQGEEMTEPAWAHAHQSPRASPVRTRTCLVTLPAVGPASTSTVCRPGSPAAAPFDPTFFLSRTVSNVISSVVFGHRFDYEDKRFLSLLHVINESFIQMSTPWAQLYDMYSSIMRYLPGPHNQIYNLIEELKNFVAEQVRGNRESLDSSNPRDFIDCFLIKMEQERNDPLSEFNLKNLVLTALNLFFAGTETVSTTLRYGFLLLMKYPEVEAKVHEEIDRVIGRERIPGIEDRMGMPYTDAVIHEIQRVTDIVPMGVPRAVTRDTHFRGYILPKGTDVFPLLGSALRDPKYFSCPDGFNPGHFLDDEGRFKKNEAFVPFASGRRVCLGEAMARMELFLYFTTVLQSFSLRSLIPAKDIDISPQVSGFSNIPPTYKFCVVPR
uniref:Cytochrome P450 n=1 Tax=Ornithorhynchus anatinus TaxID=9258 RepID=A0A6I8N1E2_ORNAN